MVNVSESISRLSTTSDPVFTNLMEHSNATIRGAEWGDDVSGEELDDGDVELFSPTRQSHLTRHQAFDGATASSAESHFDDMLEHVAEDQWCEEVIGPHRGFRSKPRVPAGNDTARRKAQILTQRTDPRMASQSFDMENSTGCMQLSSTTAIADMSDEYAARLLPVHKYIWSLVGSFRVSESIEGKQARLTLWELLEHFDFLNDLIFIIRVAMIRNEPKFAAAPSLQVVGLITILQLSCIWVISVATYACRSFLIYHRITPAHRSIFCPFIVFARIRSLGATSPESICMFEKLSWTYQLIMRVLEDIPQLIVSATFLANFGQNLYTYFMIAYSATLMVITSIRMGLTFPLFGTLSLVLSRTPPVDSPVLTEASTTTRSFALFIAFQFLLWAVVHSATAIAIGGRSFYVFLGLAASCLVLTILFVSYWGYLTRQQQQQTQHDRNIDVLGGSEVPYSHLPS